jgi:cellulose synthase/poly-beta-1,6-N-acetylglucosamine synthase-like glycosyltransferase
MIFLNFLDILTLIVGVVYFLYWGFCAVVSLVKKPSIAPSAPPKNLAVVCSARNEEAVIGNLINSVQAQNYAKDKVDVWILSDNSDDKTAEVARENGAFVVERNDPDNVGKGYALKYFFDQLIETGQDKKYDAFIILDADNTLDEDFLSKMNDFYALGYDVITSYRNSKNISSNWVSANHSLWFIRESRMLNQSRQMLGVNCHIGGTGFLVSADLIRKNKGWKHFLLTEDLEFTIDSILHGVKIGYQQEAVFYDEQPITMKQSFRQRIRWCKGFLQVFRYYGSQLFLRAFQKHDFSCIDLSLLVFPWIFFILLRQSVGWLYVLLDFVSAKSQLDSLLNVFGGYLGGVIFLFILTAITVIVERKHLYIPTNELVKHLFMFPIYSLTFLPISIAAIFSKPQWKPIFHGNVIDIENTSTDQLIETIH